MSEHRRPGRTAGVRRRTLAGLAVIVLVLLCGQWNTASAATATDAQVSVLVTQLTPKVLHPDSTVHVSGRLVNSSSHPMTSVQLRLQAGSVLTSRFALHVADNEPPAAESGWCDFTTVTERLGPGESTGFTSSCPVSTLGLSHSGVYPLKINVNAVQFDGSAARVGEANTFLPYFPDKPAAPTHVAWLWPVTDRPHRLEDGTFLDDGLAGELAPSGYLHRLIDIPASTPDVPITLALDPRLITEVLAMTRGYHVHRGSRLVEGTGRQVAKDWIAELKSLLARKNVHVVALPYGDPDLVTLAGLGLNQRMSFAFDRSETLLSDLLDVKHPLPVIWPPEGALNDQTLYALAGTSYDGLVLSSDALPGGGTGITPDAVTTINTQGGTKTALTSDRALDNLTKRTAFPNGPRIGEQRFMSELAMITAEAPDNARNVVITPPRRWSVPEQYARSMLQDTAMPWSASTSIAQLLQAPRSPQRGPLTYPGPQPSPTLSEAQRGGIVQADRSLDDFRDILSNDDANVVLTPYYESLLAASSAAFRTEPERGVRYLRDLLRRTATLRDQVRIIVPVKGTYSLASSSSPLVLTVANQLSVQVHVQVSASARGTAGFHADTVEQTIAPRSRSTVHLPAKVQRSGVFAVTAQVTSASGTPLGTPVPLRVRSTAYGGITLGITGGALGLLVILVAIRLYRRIRDTRRAHAAGSSS